MSQPTPKQCTCDLYYSSKLQSLKTKNTHKSTYMASLHTLSPTDMTTTSLSLALALFSLLSLPPTSLSQGTSLVDCTTRLLPLTPCAPFVQGSSQSPPQACCNGLSQLISQQPDCLCLLLNQTTLSSFPVNTTLALQLPFLCNLHLNSSACSVVSVPPSSSGSQVSLGANTNSSVAASPVVVTVAPRPSIMGLGRSTGIKLKTGGHLAVMVVLAAILLA